MAAIKGWLIWGSFRICFLVKTWSYKSSLVLYLHGKHKHLKIQIGRFKLESAKSTTSKCLGLTNDHDLTFNTHVSNIKYLKDGWCKNKSLFRIRNSQDEEQAKLLYNSFILSQLSYLLFCNMDVLQ